MPLLLLLVWGEKNFFEIEKMAPPKSLQMVQNSQFHWNFSVAPSTGRPTQGLRS